MATGWIPAIAALSLAFPLAVPAQQKPQLSERTQKELSNSKAHYERESNPVGRAKAIVKLGRAEIRAAREMADAGEFDAALQYLRDYSDQAHAGHEALVKTGVNAEKHSGGFRQLEISVRENVRAIRDIAGNVPYAQRGPFDDVQQGLENLDQQLILELFPDQPGHKPEKRKHEP